jgi:hypothetical protein
MQVLFIIFGAKSTLVRFTKEFVAVKLFGLVANRFLDHFKIASKVLLFLSFFKPIFSFLFPWN